jgi:molybdate-binding protein/DNA-binding XRE family transcriptional regulator
MNVRTNLAQFRAKRGFGATQLAAEVGISRQTIHAIEAGSYVPNTVVSLKLARILDTTVEELFQFEAEQKTIDETAEVFILGEPTSLAKGQPLRLVQVNGHIVAVVPDPASWGLQPSDAILLAPIRSGKDNVNARVQLLGDGWKSSVRILLAGCDPSASLLANALQKEGFELVIVYENSSRSLELLQDKVVHIAGTHLVDKVTGKTDLLPITKMFGRNAVAVISYAEWQEGLVVTQGNPKKILSITDLTRRDVRIANRELGAGCRRLLDDLLQKHDIASSRVKGYDQVVVGHLPAARMVRSGEVDCCISTEAVARALGLDFTPLIQKPYHLVIRHSQLNLPPIQALIGILRHSSFRRELESCTGYIMRAAGDHLV